MVNRIQIVYPCGGPRDRGSIKVKDFKNGTWYLFT